MDISKLRPVRISPYAREKIVLEFFEDLANDLDISTNQENLNSKII